MSIKPVAMIPEDEMQCLIDGHTAIVIPVGDELPDEVCTTLYAIPDTQSEPYWSSTPCSWDSDARWVVHFYFGYVNDYYGSIRACVRACRASQ